MIRLIGVSQNHRIKLAGIDGRLAGEKEIREVFFPMNYLPGCCRANNVYVMSLFFRLPPAMVGTRVEGSAFSCRQVLLSFPLLFS